MNPDSFLTQTLESLREPLPREQSLLTAVLARLDQGALIDRASDQTMLASRRSLRKWAVRIAIAAIVVVMIGLFRTTAPLSLAEVQAAVEQEHWVHLVYQDGSETWVCLDDGKFLMKQVRDSQPTTYFLRDPATRTEQRYDGLNEIRLTKPEVWVLGRQRNGKIIPLQVDELTFHDEDLAEPRRMPENERNTVRAVRDFEIVVENGRKLGQFSDFTRDALGKLQITKELWVDLTTKLPVRVRSWDFAAGSAKRVPRQGTYLFVDTGPADLYGLGIPRNVRVVPQIESLADAKRLIPTETWQAIDGARAAVRSFPHRFRILTLDDGVKQTITYVDSGDAHPFDWADGEPTGDSIARYFFADCQNVSAVSPGFAELVTKSADDRNAPIPADALAKAFPLRSSVNTCLIDGRRWFVLTRSSLDPPQSRLQVLTASSSQDIREIDNQWEYANWNWTELATGKSTETAPAGQILVHAERGDFKNDWFVDPQRDFTVARHVQYRLVRGNWERQETRAVKWERLPGGPWYVSVWETRYPAATPQNATDSNQVRQEEESIDDVRIVITPLRPNDFPADIFDGEKFLDAAKAAGAEIRAD